MSAASVRTSGRRDNFPVFPIEAGKRGDPGSCSKPLALRYWSRISSSLWCTGSSFSLPPFSLKRSKKRFPEVHDGADPGEGVGKDPKQSAIAEAGVCGCLDRVQKLLNLAFDKCWRFAFGPRKSLGLDFPGRIHGQHSFFREPGKQHPDGGHVLFDRGRRSLAL
jgi:hypothetical protein